MADSSPRPAGSRDSSPPSTSPVQLFEQGFLAASSLLGLRSQELKAQLYPSPRVDTLVARMDRLRQGSRERRARALAAEVSHLLHSLRSQRVL